MAGKAVGRDVPVIMLLELQQSRSCVELEVPQIQLVVGVQDIPVVSQRQLPTALSFLSRCSSWRLSTCPSLCNGRCAQLQCVDKVVNIPVESQRLIPMVPSVQRIIEIPQLPLVFRWSMSLLCLSCRFSGAAVEKTAFLLL